MNTYKKILRNITTEKPGAPTIFKRLFNLAINIAYFVLVCLLLFNVNTVPLKIAGVQKYTFIFVLIFISWYAARISNYNFYISYAKVWGSQILSMIILAYMYVVTTSFINENISHWSDFTMVIWIILPVMAVNAIWKIWLIIVARKTRPFFALEQIYALVSVVSILFIVTFHKILFDYMSEKIDPDNLGGILSLMYSPSEFINDFTEPLIVFIWISTLFLIIIVCVAQYKKRKYVKANKTRKLAMRKVAYHLCNLKIGPIAIWFMSSLKETQLDLGSIILLIISITSFVILFSIPFTRKGTINKTKLITVGVTTSILIMFMSSFVIQSNNDYSITQQFVVIIPSMLVAAFTLSIVEPKESFLFVRVYRSLVIQVVITAMIIWVASEYISESIKVVYEILQGFIMAPLLITSVILEGIIITSMWTKFISMNSNSRKLAKPKKPEKNKSKKTKITKTVKGAKNV